LTGTMVYQALAELVLVLHLCFVLFVALGGLLALRWRPVVWLHLPAVAWGVLVQCFFLACPLTAVENWLRRLGGGAVYAGGFIEHYVSAILYADVSRQFQAALGLLLIALNLSVYSYVTRRARRAA
jgi:hypothetical protein